MSKQDLIANQIIEILNSKKIYQPTKYTLNKQVILSLIFQKTYHLYLLILLIRKTGQEMKYRQYGSYKG